MVKLISREYNSIVVNGVKRATLSMIKDADGKNIYL